MTAREAAAQSPVSIAKRYGDKGMWIWKDGPGGMRGTGRSRTVKGKLQVQVHHLTEDEIEAHDDWQPMTYVEDFDV